MEGNYCMGKPSIFLIFKAFLWLSFESCEACLSCTHVCILSFFSSQVFILHTLFHAHTRGKRIVKQLPSPTTLSASTLPFMASINSLTSARPNPVPLFAPLRALSAW